MKQVWMLILASLFIVACGGGDSPGGSTSGGTSGDLPPERPTGDITVTVVTPAAASGCSVSIYDTDFDSPGTPLDTASTGPDGEAVLTVNSLDNVLYVVATGCTVREISSSTSYVQPTGEFFSAFLPYTPGNNTSVTVTPFSTFGAGLILNSITNGGDAATAMNNFSTRLNNIVGVDIDGILPTDPTSPGGITSYSNAVSYGFLMSGISCWTLDKSRAETLLDHQVYNTSSFTKVVYEDLYDDGFIQGTVTHRLGVYDITVEEVRHEIARCSLEVVKSSANDTGFNNSFYSSFATAYNDSLDPIFGASGVIPLHNGLPAFSNVTPSNGSARNNTFTFTADITDYFGISTLTLYIDGSPVQNVPFNDSTTQSVSSFTIDTTTDSNVHTFEIVATNVVGQTATTGVQQIRYDNSRPMAEETTGGLDDLLGYTNFPAVVNDSCRVNINIVGDVEKPLATARIDGIDLDYKGTRTVYAPTGLIYDVYTATVPFFGTSCRLVTLEATDAAGNQHTVRSVYTNLADDAVSWYVYRRPPTESDCVAIQVNTVNKPHPSCPDFTP